MDFKVNVVKMTLDFAPLRDTDDGLLEGLTKTAM
jgi:hypothetical protein